MKRRVKDGLSSQGWSASGARQSCRLIRPIRHDPNDALKGRFSFGRWRIMKPDKELLAAWQNGVPLRDSWYAFARPHEKQLFLELESEGLHLEFVQSLKANLIDRLYAGELRAIGVKDERNSGPIYIPKYYFLKVAKIDWDKDSLAALGEEFYNVAVQIRQGQAEEVFAGARRTDPEFVEGTQESLSETSPIDAAITIQPSRKPEADERRGRRSVIPEVRMVIRDLMAAGQFAGLRKGAIERLVANAARERFRELFPVSTQPSRNVIYRALREEGWPPPPRKSSS
jgi:hypothetical protein